MVVVILLLLVIAQAAYLWEFSIDDVGISWRYAHHLADGHGLTWNLEGPPVEGYSNFLWVILLAVAGSLGFEIETSAKVIGLELALATLILLTLILRRLFGTGRFWWAPAALVAVMPEWIAWTVSGLEIAMFGFFALLAIYAIIPGVSGRAWQLSVAMAGLTLTRPEGFVLGGVMLAAYALLGGNGLKSRRRMVAAPLATLALTLSALVGFRLLYFGYPLPNTVYAKFSSALPSLKQVGQWAVFVLPYFVAALMVLRKMSSPAQRLVIGTALLAVAAHALAILPVNPVMNHLHRYHVALLPLWMLALPVALAWLWTRRRAAASVVVVALTLWAAQGWPRARHWADAAAYRHKIQRCVVAALAELPNNPTVAMFDAGLIPYWSDLPTIDAGGLCDVDIARSTSPQAEVMKRAPAVYVTSVASMTSGFEQPLLGADKWMYQTGNFSRVYRLWRPCIGVDRPEGAYDYAILVLARWARDNRVRIPARREFRDMAPSPDGHAMTMARGQSPCERTADSVGRVPPYGPLLSVPDTTSAL
ncbi:MAG TPA: hypothetical protein VNN55_10570 [bacterium]|nr:hypothetical protein [bacterium]